ncbi:MAG: hypothetical protein HYV27_08985 [Candidatus Hydrogenedentes bacterium]|nr:hypothetical protein [Candidatus Hydrogenedentota bacterium]
MTTKRIEHNAITRRDFARYAVAASVAAAMCQSAHASRKPVDCLKITSDRCKDAIRLIGPEGGLGSAGEGMSINYLIFDKSLKANMPWFLSNADTMRVKPLLEALDAQLKVPGNPCADWTMQKFYATPLSGWDAATRVRVEALAGAIHSPWFVLKDDERWMVNEYLIRMKPILGAYDAYGFWVLGRNTHLGHGTTDGTNRWLVAREGFNIGVWRERRLPNGIAAEEDHVVPNHRCWDGNCDTVSNNDYCDTDNNGNPTTSTDPC